MASELKGSDYELRVAARGPIVMVAEDMQDNT